MDLSYAIKSAQRQLEDGQPVFHSCSRTAEQDYRDIVQLWGDLRAAAFWRTFLELQIDLMGEGSCNLASQIEASEGCYQHAVRFREGACGSPVGAHGKRNRGQTRPSTCFPGI